MAKLNQKMNIADLLSLILVVSFLIFHNIAAVLVGILISLYSINKHKINNINNSKDKFNAKKSKNKEIVKGNEIDFKIMANSKDSYESDLVEIVESLGYIPSQEKRNEDQAA